jgi:hypothetical protein
VVFLSARRAARNNAGVHAAIHAWARSLALLGLAGCGLNSFRNASFREQSAPEPTVATVVVRCLATEHASTVVVAEELTQAIGKRGEMAPLTNDERIATCTELGTDAALSRVAADWEVGRGVAGPLATKIAARYEAKSVLIPVVRSRNECVVERGAATTTVCREQEVEVGLFLFLADGTQIWKGTFAASPPRGSVVERSAAREPCTKLLADVPAQLVQKLPVPKD